MSMQSGAKKNGSAPESRPEVARPPKVTLRRPGDPGATMHSITWRTGWVGRPCHHGRFVDGSISRTGPPSWEGSEMSGKRDRPHLALISMDGLADDSVVDVLLVLLGAVALVIGVARLLRTGLLIKGRSAWARLLTRPFMYRRVIGG